MDTSVWTPAYGHALGEKARLAHAVATWCAASGDHGRGAAALPRAHDEGQLHQRALSSAAHWVGGDPHRRSAALHVEDTYGAFAAPRRPVAASTDWLLASVLNGTDTIGMRL